MPMLYVLLFDLERYQQADRLGHVANNTGQRPWLLVPEQFPSVASHPYLHEPGRAAGGFT